MISVDVRSDIKRVVAEFRAETQHIATATYRALNRAQDKAATETSREIRKVYNVRDRAVKAALKKIRANKSRLVATLRIEGARIGLIEFDARWRPGQRVGATVRIKVGEGRKPVAGTFIATRRWRSWQDDAEHAHRGVFRRAGKKRLPIRYLRSISIPQAFSNKVVQEAVQRLALESFNQNLEQQLRYLTSVE
jgi:hypothetical protein